MADVLEWIAVAGQAVFKTEHPCRQHIDAQVAEAELAVCAQGDVVTAGSLDRHVHERRIDEAQVAASRPVPDQRAFRRRKVRRTVAAGKHGARAEPRDRVVQIDIVVIHGQAHIDAESGQQIGQVGRYHEANGLRLRGFGLEFQIAAGDDIDRGRRAVSGRDYPLLLKLGAVPVAFAAGIDVAGRIAEIVAGIDRRGGESGLVGEKQFVQRRRPERGSHRSAQAERRIRGVIEQAAPGRVVAVGTVIGPAPGSIQREFLDPGPTAEQRQLHFAVDFADPVVALGASGAGETPLVVVDRSQRRAVVYFPAAPFESEHAARLARGHVEQAAFEVETRGKQVVVGLQMLYFADVVRGGRIHSAPDRPGVEQVERNAGRVGTRFENPVEYGFFKAGPRREIKLERVHDALQAAVRADATRQGPGNLVLEPGIVAPAAAAPGISDIHVPGKIAPVAVESEVQRRHVVFDVVGRVEHVVTHDGGAGKGAEGAERIGRIVRMHERKKLPVATGDHIFPAAEVELVGRACRAERFAQIEVEQTIAVDLHQFALRQQVFGRPVAVVAKSGFDEPAPVGSDRRLPPGDAETEQIARTVGNHEYRRTGEAVDIGVAADRTETAALGWREQRRMQFAIGQLPLAAGAELAFEALDRPEFGSLEREVDVAAVESLPPQHADRAVIGIVLPVDFDDEIVEASAGNDVDHAGHRVGAVNRRRAVLEHFDALHSDEGNRAEIDAGDLPARSRGGKAAAVEQHQRAAGVEIAQAEGAGAGAAGNDEAGESIVDLHTGSESAALQYLGDVV